MSIEQTFLDLQRFFNFLFSSFSDAIFHTDT